MIRLKKGLSNRMQQRLCPTRRKPMHRHGKTSAGNQRWKCVSCRSTGVRKKRDVHVRHLRHHFLQWITGTQSLTEKASEMKLARKLLSKHFKAFWAALPACPANTEPTEVLVLDDVYLSGRTNAVLIARTLSSVLCRLGCFSFASLATCRRHH